MDGATSGPVSSGSLAVPEVSSVAMRRSLLISTLLLVAVSAPAFGLTTNPIDPALPLTIHARGICTNGSISDPGSINLITFDATDGTTQAGCTGAAVHTDETTLSSVVSEGSAAADLAGGTLRARAVGRALEEGQSRIAIGSSESAYAYDTLTVDGTWTGVRNVELRMVIDGQLTSNAPTPNWQSGTQAVNSILRLFSSTGDSLGNGGIAIAQGNDGIPFVYSVSSPTSGATVTTNAAANGAFDPANVQVTISYVFPATTSNRTFSFMARLDVNAAMGFGTGLNLAEGDIDFGHTARLSLIVSPDVSLRSQSGVFLPEPASALGSLAPGIVSLILRARVRGRRIRPT